MHADIEWSRWRSGVQMRNPLVHTVCLTSIFVGHLSVAYAEKLRLDKLDRETEVYLQRGLNDADSRCLTYILEKLRKEDTKQWYISFEEPDQVGVAFGAADSDSSYSCENGQLVSYEIGEKEIIKSFK
ncbi:hypothetical protein QLQ09_08800 [Brucella sp. NM4]|uniref:hypothetical protein n=1 Tax=Brucella/Ochrobactrum group TaxID=2826938 RepID=UPI0024BC6D32|nr:hypothetical protein [Brucella sp. NM4]WHS32054.1 hypothetical protein QLQ09_08800 [Brucella sp. NM4]WHT41465.1 hypothetical protein QLQ11_08585 [Ochrobactrum sp. SSR]